MRFARCIPNTTNTHSEYVVLPLTLQQWPHGRASVLTFIRRLPVLHTHTMVQRFRDCWNTAVDIATRYGLDDPGFEPRWGRRDFRTRPDRPRGPPSLLYNGYRVSFSGVKLHRLKTFGRGLRSPFGSDKTWQISRGRERVCWKSISKDKVALPTQCTHIIIIIIQYVCLLSQAFLPGTSLEPAVIPTAQASSFTLQYFPYYVWCSKYSCLL